MDKVQKPSDSEAIFGTYYLVDEGRKENIGPVVKNLYFCFLFFRAYKFIPVHSVRKK
jgi:hypothetical protein